MTWLSEESFRKWPAPRRNTPHGHTLHEQRWVRLNRSGEGRLDSCLQGATDRIQKFPTDMRRGWNITESADGPADAESHSLKEAAV